MIWHVRQHSTSKFCFYHLPTRGRVGVKLGEADMFPTYLQFLIVPCYYIIRFGCLWALLNTFILFLGLTYWPRAQCQFLFFSSLFQCFEEKEYQTESKRNETFGTVIFRTNVIQRTWSASQGINEEGTRQGARPPPGPALHPRGPSWLPSPTSFAYICPYTLKTSGNRIDREFRRRKPL